MSQTNGEPVYIAQSGCGMKISDGFITREVGSKEGAFAVAGEQLEGKKHFVFHTGSTDDGTGN